jgi:hypothetical protein
MKDLFMNDNEAYDIQNVHNDSTMMEDMSSYRPGDSLAETEVSSSQQPNEGFIEKFRFWSILGFTSTLMCTWELAIGSVCLVSGVHLSNIFQYFFFCTYRWWSTRISMGISGNIHSYGLRRRISRRDSLYVSLP